MSRPSNGPRTSQQPAPAGGSAAPVTADERLGEAVRARRHALGLTLVEVASASELSHSFLSQLERGHARPSMRSLYLIAQALGTTQQAFLAAAAPPSTSPVGLGLDVPSAQTATPAVQVGAARLLSHVEGGADVTEFLNVPDTFEDYFAHGRHELVYVVSGHIEVELCSEAPHEGADDAPHEAAQTTTLYSLAARQSIGYPGSVRHRHRRVGPAECVVLVVHSGPEDVEDLGDVDRQHDPRHSPPHDCGHGGAPDSASAADGGHDI